MMHILTLNLAVAALNVVLILANSFLLSRVRVLNEQVRAMLERNRQTLKILMQYGYVPRDTIVPRGVN
jgi:hypothetical protein